MEYPNSNGKAYLSCFTATTGAVIPADGTGATKLGVANYYYPLGGQAAPLESVHVKWNSAIAVTLTIEDCNFDLQDVSNYDETAGNWIKEDPSTAYIATVGAGATVTNATVAVTAGSAGGCVIHVGNTGAKRTRLKAAVTTAGTLTVAPHGKA